MAQATPSNTNIYISPQQTTQVQGAAGVAQPAVATRPVLVDASVSQMPPPYVSRALQAVLVPINDAVRQTWGLSAWSRGVLVLSVQPDGVAARNGIQAGDVISRVHGFSVMRPVDLDTAIVYWTNRGTADFEFDGYRNNAIFHPRASIGRGVLSAVVDIAHVASWLTRPAPHAGRFNYGSYYSSYRPALQHSYAAAPHYIQQSVAQPHYTSAFSNAAVNTVDFDTVDQSYRNTSYNSENQEFSDNKYTDFDGSNYNLGSGNNAGNYTINNITNNTGGNIDNIVSDNSNHVSSDNHSVTNSDDSVTDNSVTDKSDNRTTDNSVTDNSVTDKSDNSVNSSDNSVTDNSDNSNNSVTDKSDNSDNSGNDNSDNSTTDNSANSADPGGATTDDNSAGANNGAADDNNGGADNSATDDSSGGGSDNSATDSSGGGGGDNSSTDDSSSGDSSGDSE